MEFLKKIERNSQDNPRRMFDHATALINKENIPEDSRAFYYQQVLSALPINEDFTIDHVKARERHDELKQKISGLSHKISELQKNSDAHHKQFQTSLKKITNAVNDNAADIAALKSGQKEIIDFLKDQKNKSDEL